MGRTCFTCPLRTVTSIESVSLKAIVVNLSGAGSLWGVRENVRVAACPDSICLVFIDIDYQDDYYAVARAPREKKMRYITNCALRISRRTLEHAVLNRVRVRFNETTQSIE